MFKNPATPFTTVIEAKVANQLLADLQAQGFEISQPPYTRFSAKKKGVSCTLYQSGKLVVQGKEKQPFIEFYLEPEILKSFTYGYEEQLMPHSESAHIGIDESGKGDFFGPLCVAGVFATVDQLPKLKTLGVKDSKKISDAHILKIGKKIRAEFAHHVIRINPRKYNELYLQFKNLNSLLAWGHATAIEQLVAKTQCTTVTIDQFANEQVVLTALKRKKLEVDLTQRHRAEEDSIVAAASILAREAFLIGLEELSQQYNLKLPKGASAGTIAAGREFFIKYGKAGLEGVAKMHFKTLHSILDSSLPHCE